VNAGSDSRTPLLQIFIVSTREGRKGDAVARWFDGCARRHGAFDVELVDLAEVGLPMFDEPEHPRFRKYQHEHTKRWSERVARADAFVFVTPEYNYSAPPSLVNALDYLVHEWAYKPVGFVSYGGVSGGTRSVQMTKLLVTALKMMPIPEAVSLPFFTRMFASDGTFAPDEMQSKAADTMLKELKRWTSAMQTLRR
jgi:NAD(P)H-dependent FMN reductase